MKKSILIPILSSFLLASCNATFLDGFFNKKSEETQNEDSKEGSQSQNEDIQPTSVDPAEPTEPAEPTDPIEPTDPTDPVDPSSDVDPTEDDPDIDSGISVSFSKRVIDIDKSGKTTYLSVNVSGDIKLADEEYHYTSSNLNVATVDDFGRLKGIAVGSAVITFSLVKYDVKCSMTVYVHESLDDIVREYIRLDNPDDIKVGDELVFASPNLGLAASVNIQSGYIVPAPLTFSSDKSKIATMSQYVAEYYVGPGSSEDVFTLENQEGNYLACKDTTGGRKLVYSDNGKAQINWIVEKPEGYDETFIVSFDLIDDYWLMFNKVSKDNSDIRFNIYDSNEQAGIMEKPIIYRKTIIRN